MVTRRKFISRVCKRLAVAVAAGYTGFRVASYNGWIHVTHNARSFEKGRAPSRAIESQSVNLLVVGDTGMPSVNRVKVVQAMREHLGHHRCDAALLLGDNFYESGVESVADARFRTDFEDLFDAATFAMPFYVALGNHDYGGDVDAQIEYSDTSDRWMMPARYYKRTIQHAGVVVELFVTDTNQLLEGGPSAADQLRWFRRELSLSDATWKVVVGHHPVLSGGRHHPESSISATIRPILDHYSVDFYLSGHDHDLQLLDSGKGWRQVVSGSGSKLRSTSWIDETIFAKACPGFVSMTLSATHADLSYYSTDSRLMTARYQRASQIS